MLRLSGAKSSEWTHTSRSPSPGHHVLALPLPRCIALLPGNQRRQISTARQHGAARKAAPALAARRETTRPRNQDSKPFRQAHSYGEIVHCPILTRSAWSRARCQLHLADEPVEQDLLEIDIFRANILK